MVLRVVLETLVNSLKPSNGRSEADSLSSSLASTADTNDVSSMAVVIAGAGGASDADVRQALQNGGLASMEMNVTASSLDFPHTIGPFVMGRANLADAFNAFYRQHQFPRPDWRSNENSMAGFDPSRCRGLGHGDILFCQLSPLHRITLDTEAMEAANIPTASTFFAWAYPIVQPPDAPVNLTDTTEGAFLKYGGYIYFNDRMEILATNAISPRPLGTMGLMFGRPQNLPQSVSDTLTRQGRFQEITLDALREQAATDFAWIRPGEFADLVACPDGAFAYKFANGRARYFPVVGIPAYTPELFDEELDANEAWVVVRSASSLPQIEKLVIFDKNQNFLENTQSCASPIAVDQPFSRVVVTRDWAPDLQLTYDEWTQSPDRGTLVDPWIITVERS